MRRVLQSIVVVVILLGLGSLGLAQQTPTPVVRTGNFIEVGNDLFMHIIATMDARYKTSQNADFEDKIRDRALSRSPTSTAQHQQEGDLFFAELRFGADFRYQKSLTAQLLFENQSVFDGSLIDDRANTSNPGGASVFGGGAATENPGFRIERFWLRYKFPGTPLGLLVGAILDAHDQAGLYGSDDPRIAVEAQFGDLALRARIIINRESQRLGLQNDNDAVSYAFDALYDLKPHRFGFGVLYTRDRFFGADTREVGCDRTGLEGCTGQKTDSVWINASWSGKMGPIRGLLQGNLVVGTARGGTAGLPSGVPVGRDYDIFAGAALAYVEATFGVVTPFVGFIFGSADGNPNDDKLQGFQAFPINESTQVTANGFLNHLDTSVAFALRDYSCPARSIGVRNSPTGLAGNRAAVGSAVVGEGDGTFECAHSTSNVFNSHFGNVSHPGIYSNYSNPGTLLIPVGLKVAPVKGHELAGWYVYRAIVDSALLERAFVRGTDPGFTGQISKTLYHGIGGQWQWTLNPHFDIRLSGEIAVPGEGYKDLGRLADCDPSPTNRRACDGNDPALRAEARFRARF